MTSLPQTFSSYAIDRRPVADVSSILLTPSELADILTGLYDSGFRRFVVPTFSPQILWDDSQACSDWAAVISSFVESCEHPVLVVARHAIEDYVDPLSGLILQSYLDDQITNAFAAGISGFLSQPSGSGLDGYSGCSHPQLRQLLSRFDNAYIWRDATQDPYLSVTGSCDLPEWYQAPAEVLSGRSPYSGWSSEPMRRSVEVVVVIPSNLANATNFSVCASWGFVPCLKLSSFAVGISYSSLTDSYLSEENKIKSTFARSKQIVISSSGARRECGDVPASSAFYNSDARGEKRIVCPANIDCSHFGYDSGGVSDVSSATCSVMPMFSDPLWAFNAGASVSGKLSVDSMFGSRGASKAAELALEILADEFAAHPDIDYLGELSSVVILSNWGRGGHADTSHDSEYESSRLTVHVDDVVNPVLGSRPLLNARDTLYNSNGIFSCSSWMREFVKRFDAYRQRMAVFAGCSIPVPWMVFVKSRLQVATDSAVCNPSLVDGVLKYGNWPDQRADTRWGTEGIADFGSGLVTAQQFSAAGQEYTCKAYKPDGTFAKYLSTADLQVDISSTESIGNRPFAKWYGDLSRAAAANALSKSIGVMLSHHFTGCATACPGLVPNNQGAIVSQEQGKPVFCQTQQKPFFATAVTSTPAVFMAHTGMIAQGHASLPKVPPGVRLLAKCTTDGSQRPNWYTSSPIGDCSWEYGDESVPFSFSVSSSSSSSVAYDPVYHKTSLTVSLSAPSAPSSVETNIYPMRDLYLGSSSVSSEAP